MTSTWFKGMVFLFCLSGIFATAEGTATKHLHLPEIFTDNMVLQRNMKIPVWGWAPQEQLVTITFKGKNYATRATAEGTWRLEMDRSAAAGPYEMDVKSGAETVKIRNIMVGEVWVCSGQSNMVLDFNDPRLRKTYAKEIATSGNYAVREILVNRTYASRKAIDFKSSGWVQATPRTIRPFSAAAYFFGRTLCRKYHVTVGLINTCYGGTEAECWTSRQGLEGLSQFGPGIAALHDTQALRARVRTSQEAYNAWNREVSSGDRGLSGGEALWASVAFQDTGWTPVYEPGLWGQGAQNPIYGVCWLRKTIVLPQREVTGKQGVLRLGHIEDADSVYFNGHVIGHSNDPGNNQAYRVPAAYIHGGDNLIAVRILNFSGGGGISPDANLLFTLDRYAVSLKGIWKFREGLRMKKPRQGVYNPKNLPTALFNAMIAPLIPYAIRGVIWYQGEYNTDRAYEYRSLFPALIRDWRSRWQEGDFPFIYQQLPNFQKPVSQPSENNWAELREAQLLTLDKLPDLGMAVAIDIGGADQLHPVDKKDIGKRLALQAEKMAYGEDIVASGPLYTSMRVEGNKVVLHFNDTGSGLVAKGGGGLKYFAVAGADRKFEWATAVIRGNTVIVFNKDIPHPVAVRYAWAGDPEGCNFYNKEGLPASPFRTDNWPGLTFNKRYVYK